MLTPALVDGPVTVYVGDALETLRQLPSDSVHMVCCSPPYWGLRDYSATGQLGLEPTPELYVEHMVEVFRELRRVLRRDGTCWLNLGDSYAGSWGNQGRKEERGSQRPVNGEMLQPVLDGRYPDKGSNTGALPPGLKPKDLIGIPWRVAFALQADGWWLRSDIIWSKPNPMPESVTDRPTKSHEYVFLLTKSANYFYDAEGVREASQERAPWAPISGKQGVTGMEASTTASGRRYTGFNARYVEQMENGTLPAGRNLRSVWTIATQPYPEAHFATFPEDLVIPCVKAGTSEHGVCAECGAPWVRVVERVEMPDMKRPDGWDTGAGGHGSYHRNGREAGQTGIATKPVTSGWRPTCRHAQLIPATVLDPFAGSGSTLAVARRLGRRSIGIELQVDYLPLIRKRVEEAALPLLDAVQPEPNGYAPQQLSLVDEC